MDKPKCRAHKKDGTPCGRWPVRGSTVCTKHGGSAPQVRRKAVERLIAASDLAAGRLIEFMNDARVPHSVRLAATRDLLDRAVGPAAQTVKLGIAQEDPWADLLSEVMGDEVLEPVDVRSLPRRRTGPAGGGAIFREDDEDFDYNARAVQSVDSDEDDPGELSFNIPGRTVPGEVIHDYPAPTPEEAAGHRRTAKHGSRALMASSGREGPQRAAERSEYGAPETPAADDPTRPPAYVREAMDAEGLDWREPGKGCGTKWSG